jgi:hypothetical protein
MRQSREWFWTTWATRLLAVFNLVNLPAAANHVRHHPWGGYLAIVVMVLQPLLLSLHCGPVSAHSHSAHSPSTHAHKDSQSSHHAHEVATPPVDHRDAHHSQSRGDHHHLREYTSGYGQHSSLALSATPDHQHELCCSHSGMPFVQMVPAVKSIEERQGVSTASQAAVLTPLYKLHVSNSIHSRAGPSSVPLLSAQLPLSLHGRAPPLSA